MRRRLGVGCVVGLMAMSGAAQTPTKPVAPVKAAESVTVRADRGLAGINDLASSVAVLTQEQMLQAPGLALDDKLHSVAGFQLFRRTSSWTANPTSQGVSLRGLGSTAASRTLVVSDEVPLNDPFGGWIHWDEVPALAIDQVQLLRGGAADLYGSSAIGGLVDVVPVTAGKRLRVEADASGATENSGLSNLLVSDTTRWAGFLGAYSGLRTGGYIPTAPELRGPVDVPSNVASDSGRMMMSKRDATGRVHGFLLGNVLNETRSNGTPLQTNATRLWRYAGGGDASGGFGSGALRVFGSRESYRQSFSSVTSVETQRDTERLTKLQHVPLDEFGVVANAARALRRDATAAVGVDLRDVRATDDETSTTVTPRVLTSIGARQRAVGGYADAIWQPGAWSLSGSMRVDSFRTFDARKVVSNAATVALLPELNELFVSPHVGLVRRLPYGLALTGTAFRAFRGPTLNELYRTGQVGQQTTLANNALLMERATGFEFGGEADGRAGHLRSTYFWTEVNRPISAVALSQTATTQTLQRQNLGQIRSRGMMLEAQSRSWHALNAGVGYQLAVATVTAFNATSAVRGNLLAKWIPEVARESVTATVNYNALRVMSVHLLASYAGREYDDAANTFVLSPYARFDVSMERELLHGLFVFAGAQNVLNRRIDAGLTPLLTLAAPRLVEAGLRYRFGR